MASSATFHDSHIEGTTARLSPFSGQAILIAAVIAALGLLILPVSAPVLDALLALNFILTLAVFAAGFSFSDPVRFSAFPGILLLLTLFRLTITLGSTRLILAEGHAGDLVSALGNLAAGGNAVIGAVVFLVMQIVHFLVVSKGSERIAEVAARFTLDALPGKQMSIDADLRAGLIGESEARRKRAAILHESRFYGAMDGAMKFVKGECAAVFAVACVNLIGGFCVGVIERGLPLASAAKIYAILAIGDGLAAELPAFVVAMTAGFLVTRVPAADGSSLGKDIATQLFQDPKPLGGAAIALSGLAAALPGPSRPFFALCAFALGTAAFLLTRGLAALSREKSRIRKHEALPESMPPGLTLPLVLEAGTKLRDDFENDFRWQNCFDGLYPRLRSLLSNRMGVPFPELKIGVDDTLPETRYRIRIHGIAIEENCIPPGTAVPEETLLRRLGLVLRRHARDFVGIQEVRDVLTGLEERAPELVREVVPRLLSLTKLTDVVRRLVDEDIPVSDFRLILETLASCGQEAKDPVALTEQVRIGMKRSLSRRHADAAGKILVFLIDPEIETAIAKGITRDGADCYLSLPPETSERFAKAFTAAYARLLPGEARPVVLTDVGIRRYVRKLIENEMPEVAVLSYQELEPGVAIRTQDTIGLEAA